MKDNFSEVSNEYSRFRPGYPQELYNFLKTEIKCFERAWDCGTGNGQVAVPLSQMFRMVYATDISTNQLQNATPGNNIIYSRQPAEKTNFGSEMFDLVTVGQAIHWFDFDQFYGEVNRTLKKDGSIAVMGYGLVNTDPETQELIHQLYYNILDSFWDPERKFIEQKYSTIPFPFRERPVPIFNTILNWNIHQLVGYLKTWSAVQHFIKKNGYDPVQEIIPELELSFGKGGEVTFPIFLRLGKKE
ncbi:MAG TPA: class I SAM-dependent methyltransferase [Gillisia sp.]|nr:class I SAM-dependent methyltransferase [Gillisia sp.]